MPPDPHSAAVDDDRSRVARWVAEHAQAVRGFLLAQVRRDDVADDLLQETFQRAWQARDRYAENGRERSYLLRIADRLAVDHARRQQRREATQEEQAWEAATPYERDGSPEQSLVLAEEGRLLTASLQLLNESQRRVLTLRFYGDLEFAEIAEAMNCPLGTVLSHCHRGLAKLRKHLASCAP